VYHVVTSIVVCFISGLEVHDDTCPRAHGILVADNRCCLADATEAILLQGWAYGR